MSFPRSGLLWSVGNCAPKILVWDFKDLRTDSTAHAVCGKPIDGGVTNGPVRYLVFPLEPPHPPIVGSNCRQIHRISGMFAVPQLIPSVEVSMIAALSETFRGVHCCRCGKPVRVPNVIANRETDSVPIAENSQHLVSQVFVLRCRACGRESVYSVNQVVAFSLDVPD